MSERDEGRDPYEVLVGELQQKFGPKLQIKPTRNNGIGPYLGLAARVDNTGEEERQRQKYASCILNGTISPELISLGKRLAENAEPDTILARARISVGRQRIK